MQCNATLCLFPSINFCKNRRKLKNPSVKIFFTPFTLSYFGYIITSNTFSIVIYVSKMRKPAQNRAIVNTAAGSSYIFLIRTCTHARKRKRKRTLKFDQRQDYIVTLHDEITESKTQSHDAKVKHAVFVFGLLDGVGVGGADLSQGG